MPAPEEPTSTTVCPALSHGANADTLCGSPGVDRAHGHLLRGQFDQRGDRAGHVGAGIGLGQHHYGLGTATAYQQAIAFDAARVEVGIQATDDEHCIDVGADHLLLVMLAGRRALDGGTPR